MTDHLVLRLWQKTLRFFYFNFFKPDHKSIHYNDRLEKLLHVMENLNIPYPVEDFDVLNGTEKEHRERFEKVNTEVLVTMMVNMLIHLIMLAPLWSTGK